MLRIKGSRRALALKVDSNPRACALDPYLGAVGDGDARRRATSRARARGRWESPIASTTEIPSGPRSCGSSSAGVEALRDASIAFGAPVVSGNVSFYNETEGRAIPPTPTIAVLGVMIDVAQHVTQHFKTRRRRDSDCAHRQAVAGGDASTRRSYGDRRRQLSPIDLARESALIEGLVEGAEQGLIRSAHDVAEGGLAVAMAEACFNPEAILGAKLILGARLGRRGGIFWRRAIDRRDLALRRVTLPALTQIVLGPRIGGLASSGE